MNIPTKFAATCFVKCGTRRVQRQRFAKGVAPLPCKKTVPDNGRECLFAARSDSYRELSGDFQGLGMIAVQVEEKAPVLGQPITEQAPQ